MSDALDFWFDFHSPWSYLAAEAIEALAARRGRGVRWRPLHLPRLIEAIGGRRSLEESAAFVAWYKQDLEDWAALRGVTIRYHPHYPLRPARALRATLYADGQGEAAPFARDHCTRTGAPPACRARKAASNATSSAGLWP